MFSSRIPSDRRPNRIAAAAAAVRADGLPWVDLTESNPTLVGLEYPARLAALLARKDAIVYRPAPFGLPEARRAVAERLSQPGQEVSVDEMILTASTSESYGLLFKLLCDPGDAVLVPRPSYPLFEHLTALEGVTASPYALEYDGGWRIDFAGLERAVTPRTKAIVVVSPNNPTGSFVAEGEIARLAELCRSRSLALIGDEVFADYAWNGTRPPSVLGQGAALAFSLGGLSKSAGLPQMKLGWIGAGGPDGLVREALARLEVICDMYLSVSTPVQLALGELMDLGAEVRDQIRARIAANRAQLESALRAAPWCRQLRADGGWYTSLRIPTTRAEEDLVLELLEHDRVLVHPGWFFDFPFDGVVVVSLLPPTGDFARGIAAVCRRAGPDQGPKTSRT